MNFVRAKLPVLIAVLTALLVAAFPVRADEWIHTGTSVRVKTIAFVDFDVYEISHFMKQAPAAKSKQAVINAEVSKKFTWKMLRDVDKEKIHDALKGAFAMNGYTDSAKINAFMAAFSGELKEGARVTIAYDPDKKSTSVSVGGGGSATVAGQDFMKAVWSIWFGKIDQPKMGDQLLSKLP